MAEDADGPTPPEGLPEHVANELSQLNDEELRNAIIHARELLQSHNETGPPIEPQPGEDIIKVTEHDGYTEVVKRVPCGENCPDCPHGPYLYHVTEEPSLAGGKHTHWAFIGEVQSNGD